MSWWPDFFTEDRKRKLADSLLRTAFLHNSTYAHDGFNWVVIGYAKPENVDIPGLWLARFDDQNIRQRMFLPVDDVKFPRLEDVPTPVTLVNQEAATVLLPDNSDALEGIRENRRRRNRFIRFAFQQGYKFGCRRARFTETELAAAENEFVKTYLVPVENKEE